MDNRRQAEWPQTLSPPLAKSGQFTPDGFTSLSGVFSSSSYRVAVRAAGMHAISQKRTITFVNERAAINASRIAPTLRPGQNSLSPLQATNSMSSIIERHVQTFDEIRRTGLLCHGLDLSSCQLFSGSQEYRPSSSIQRVLSGSLSSGLLHFAIAIRVNIYQSSLMGFEKRHLPWWVPFYYRDELKSQSIDLKSVCDKIIHADTVEKAVLPAELTRDSKTCMHFVGRHQQREWVMDVPVSWFVEYVFALLDEIESKEV